MLSGLGVVINASLTRQRTSVAGAGIRFVSANSAASFRLTACGSAPCVRAEACTGSACLAVVACSVDCEAVTSCPACDQPVAVRCSFIFSGCPSH